MSQQPRLARHLSMTTVALLSEWSAGPQGSPEQVAEGIAAAGYEGVQAYDPAQLGPARAAGLATSALGRVDKAVEVEAFVDGWEQLGVSSLTTHLGTGFEDDSAAHELVEAFLRVSAAASIEVLVETHRATLTQDPARTARLVERYPELRFTADLSHWYVGAELPYGGFGWKLEALAPVWQRVRVIHGRIADPGCAQVAVDDGDESRHVRHFRRMWQLVFESALPHWDGGPDLVFAPELLPAEVNYARTVPTENGREEEVDRWQQAQLLCEIAEELFAAVTTSNLPPKVRP